MGPNEGRTSRWWWHCRQCLAPHFLGTSIFPKFSTLSIFPFYMKKKEKKNNETDFSEGKGTYARDILKEELTELDK